MIWAMIIAIAQVLHIAKPYIPFLGNEKDYLEMSFEFDALYLKYERLWYLLERGQIEEAEAEQKFYELREKEVEIEKTYKHARCPKSKRYIDKVYIEAEKALNLNFFPKDNRKELSTGCESTETTESATR